MNPLFPSILSSNFFDLDERLRQYRTGGIEVIHLDIMDGHFVDAITFGPALARAIRARFPFAFDAHLMVTDPERIVPWFLDAGCGWVSFHVEAAPLAACRRLCAAIRARGGRAGLVLNPETPLAALEPLLDASDYVLLMSVAPGRGGQPFQPAVLEKARRLRTEIDRRGLSCLIQMDGGLGTDNLADVRAAGVELFVVGNFLYRAADVPATLQRIYEQIQWSPT